jgi:hypothetical protein
MSRYSQLSRLDLIGRLESEEASHRDTKAILNKVRRVNLMLEFRNTGDVSEETEDYISSNTSPNAHQVQGLKNQIMSMTGMHESERHVFQSQMNTYKEQLATSKKLIEDLVARNQELNTENQRLKANSSATTFQQQNLGAGPVINNFYGTQTAAAPATPAQVPAPHRAMAKLTINDDTLMSDDVGIEMPYFKDRCDMEQNGHCHRKTKCAYLHQSQIDKFGAEDIERLPANRKALHQPKRKRV